MANKFGVPETLEEWQAAAKTPILRHLKVGGREFALGPINQEDAALLREFGEAVGNGRPHHLTAEPFYVVHALLRGGNPEFSEWDWVKPRLTREDVLACVREHMRQSAALVFAASQ